MQAPAELEKDGFCLVPDFMDAAGMAFVDELVLPFEQAGKAGARNLLADSRLRSFCSTAKMKALADALVGGDAFPVRAILFDKTPEANWKVPWHQDLSIAVQARHDVAGYGPWSVKDGVVHVQPPAAVLERMVTIRLHLDDCLEENGPVRVLPGTHALGRIPADQVDEMALTRAEECLSKRGGVLVMKPLLLHASSPAKTPGRRRVLHVEYACSQLEWPLEWHVSQG